MTALESDEKSAVEDRDDAERGECRRRLRAALICHRCRQTGSITVEWTYWDSRQQARQAEVELTPCGPLCIGLHSVVRLDSPPEPRRPVGSGWLMSPRSARARAVEFSR